MAKPAPQKKTRQVYPGDARVKAPLVVRSRATGLRASTYEIEILDKAAELDGRSRQSFILHYGLQVAQRIIEGKPLVLDAVTHRTAIAS